jgi:hypothetical protein
MKRREDRLFYPVVGLAATLVIVVLYFAVRQMIGSRPVLPVPPAPEKKIDYAPPDGIAPASLPRVTPAQKGAGTMKHRRTSVPPPP